MCGATHAGLIGLWIGITTGSMLSALALFVYLRRLDWHALCQQVSTKHMTGKCVPTLHIPQSFAHVMTARIEP
jgi:hypothetical protein